jgi:hypothetical protein
MTQAAEILVPTRTSEDKLIAGVCIAHFVSHYYMMLLAPLFVFIKDDYGVTDSALWAWCRRSCKRRSVFLSTTSERDSI